MFVDFEYLCRSSRSFSPQSSSFAGTVLALLERVRELGIVVVANVYADWEQFPGMQTELKRLELDPRFVLPQSSLKELSFTRGSFTVLTMALDCLQTLYERDDIEIFALVTGDGGFLDLVGRLKGRRKCVTVIGFEQRISEELRQAASRFEALDDFIQPEPEPDTPPSPEAYTSNLGADFNWEPFVQLLNRLEQSLPFVSLKYLKNQVLTPLHGCDNTQESKANLIREAIRLRIIETRKIPNPRNPHFATTACRLNRKHTAVKHALGLSPREA